MPEVPPPTRVDSSTVTVAPACASRYATEAPITPAPITIVLINCILRFNLITRPAVYDPRRPGETVAAKRVVDQLVGDDAGVVCVVSDADNAASPRGRASPTMSRTARGRSGSS